MGILRHQAGKNRESQQRRFDKCILPQLDALYRTALHLTRNRQEAEDLVQETCLRAYSALERFDGQHSRAWLFTILRHVHISRWRHDGHGAQTVSYDDDTDDGGDTLPQVEKSAEEQVLAGLLAEDLERALGRLPDDARMMLVLAYVEDWSYAEIAKVMDCPIGTVMSRLFRARRQLEESLTPAPLNEPGLERE